MAIHLPVACRRGSDCQPLAEVASDGGATFICVGINSGADRQVAQDDLTMCAKSLDADNRINLDRRDMADQLSVMAQALSALANMKK